MSNLILLLKCLSEEGLCDLIQKKEENESFQEYVIENIREDKKNTGRNIIIYNKLLFLYDSSDCRYFYSNFGPYSPETTEEIIELRNILPKNKKLLSNYLGYSKISEFLKELKKSAKELTFENLVELACYKWIKNYKPELIETNKLLSISNINFHKVIE
jgi:uncharacterized protein YwgA